MAQTRNVERQIEIKCDANKFFGFWASISSQVGQMCSSQFPDVKLTKGANFQTIGAIATWNFISPVDGKHESVKTELVAVDEKKRSFTYKQIEGDLLNKYYNTWTDMVEIVPKGENCSIVIWRAFDCEKKSENAPNPEIYVDFLLGCIKEIDHLLCYA